MRAAFKWDHRPRFELVSHFSLLTLFLLYPGSTEELPLVGHVLFQPARFIFAILPTVLYSRSASVSIRTVSFHLSSCSASSSSPALVCNQSYYVISKFVPSSGSQSAPPRANREIGREYSGTELPMHEFPPPESASPVFLDLPHFLRLHVQPLRPPPLQHEYEQVHSRRINAQVKHDKTKCPLSRQGSIDSVSRSIPSTTFHSSFCAVYY